MNVSVDSAAVVLLKHGLKAQAERERELESLHGNFESAATDEDKQTALDELGQSIFNR